MILFTGPVYDSSGYAVASRGIVNLLCDIGFEVKLFPNKNWKGLGAKLEKEELELIKSLIVDGGGLVKTDHLTVYSMQTLTQGQIPVEFKKTSEIVHTMFETDRCPVHWVDPLNNVSSVFVSSKWGVETFKLSGVKNVEYMPFWIDTDVFSPETPKLLNDPRFKFLFIGELNARKNLRGLLQAYFHAFRNNKDVVLFVKSWVGTKEKLKIFVESVGSLRTQMGVNKFPTVILFNDQIPSSYIPGLINSCDCLVAPSCGEGFGFPQLYAMSCAKPVIGVSWSAPTDYFTNENSILIEYEVGPVSYEIVKQDSNFYGHHWAIPNLEHLSRLLKWAYGNKPKLDEIGKVARKTVIDKYNYSVVKGMTEKYFLERSLS